MNKNDHIIIVGAGTAGLISALILKTRFPKKRIQVIESSKVGIVGVGESSTEHWADFCTFVGIELLDTILYANSTFKIGVYFDGWSEHDYMHSLGGPFVQTLGSYYQYYAHIIANQRPPSEMQLPGDWRNEVNMGNFNHKSDSPSNQFHFDTFALNNFLHTVAKVKEIEFIVDDLTSAKLCEKTGNIISVISAEREYTADFFIDCSGFAKLLMGKTYGIKWVSYAEYLPTNSAIAFATPEMDEYNKYTKSTARKYGWSWKIPVQGRTGNGYVFSDGFTSLEETKAEMEEAYGHEIEVARKFKFDPGRLEKAWHKNCYAVGLSQSFVEPLEATSISSIIQQMFCFMHFFPSNDADSCNKHVNAIFDNIADYIRAHYLVKREDTPFWKYVKYDLKLTPKLEEYLMIWKHRLPNSSDVICPWGLFGSANYIDVLYGLGWFDVHAIRNEYLQYDIQDQIHNQLEQNKAHNNNLLWMSHKLFIDKIVERNR